MRNKTLVMALALAAVSAVAILALSDSGMKKKLDDFRARQTDAVLKAPPLTLK